MSILSLNFIVFLVILATVYFLVPDRFQWIGLLLGSMVFYVMAGGWFALLFIYFTAFSIYAGAVLMARYPERKKVIMVLDIIINLGILVVLKYGIFILKESAGLVSLLGVTMDIPEGGWILPLGISFYTLQAIGYLVDVYKGRFEPEKNFFRFALFVTFFPQLIQGPFSRFQHLGGQFFEAHKWDYERVKHGVELMVWGYMMKLIVGDRGAILVTAIMDGYEEYGHEGFTIIVAMFIFCFQLYADFFGGMNIVYGVSEILGINLPQNFRQPYFAKSVSEYWRRWHITLGEWMKNYVFYPIALSAPFAKLNGFLKKRFGRAVAKAVPPSLATFIVFLLVGIWHGADMKYVVYGVYMAVLVSSNSLLEDVYKKMRGFFHINAESFSWKMFQMIRTFILIFIGNYLSDANTLDDAIKMLRRSFSVFNPWVFWDGSLYNLGLNQRNFAVMLIGIVVIMIVDVVHERGIRIRESLDRSDVVLRWTFYILALFVIVVFGMYGADVTARDFIYQGF